MLKRLFFALIAISSIFVGHHLKASSSCEEETTSYRWLIAPMLGEAVSFERDGFGHSMGAREIRGLLASRKGFVLGAVAERGDKLLGTMLYDSNRELGVVEVLSIAVNPAVRGQGVGTAFLQSYLNKWRTKGNKFVLATINAKNEAGMRLFRKAGFELLHKLPDFYEKPVGGTRDAVLMGLSLTGQQPDAIAIQEFLETKLQYSSTRLSPRQETGIERDEQLAFKRAVAREMRLFRSLVQHLQSDVTPEGKQRLKEFNDRLAADLGPGPTSEALASAVLKDVVAGHPEAVSAMLNIVLHWENRELPPGQ